MEDLEALLCLNMVSGLGPVKIRRLVEHFKSPKDILKAGINELRNVEGIDEILAGSIRSRAKEAPLEKELKLIRKLGLVVLSILDDDYPKNLKEIYDPPIIIYVKGIIKKEDSLSISIVGTRLPSYYGLSQAEKFSYVLAARGITVVSGMARGIDSASHKGALKAGGRTIAVLGSGLGVIYPSENRELFERISAFGAVISEFPVETPPNRENFPRRNRIISGLSLGTLVVEATKNSGSLITARFALEQNREVFALPGNVSSSGSIGTNKLIKEGAKLVEDIEDIIEEIEPFRKLVEKKKVGKESGPDFSTLDIKEKLFLKELSNDSPVHLDQIIAALNLPAGELIALAARLELKGMIKQLPGKFFVYR
jgi:DNA processing protein